MPPDKVEDPSEVSTTPGMSFIMEVILRPFTSRLSICEAVSCAERSELPVSTLAPSAVTVIVCSALPTSKARAPNAKCSEALRMRAGLSNVLNPWYFSLSV